MSGGDRDRGGLPDFLTNSGHVGMPEFSSIFPGLFRSEKNWEKSREIGKNRGNQEKSRETGKDRGKSPGKLGTIPTFPDLPRTF